MRTIIISGASRGIGLNIAHKELKEGNRISVGIRNLESLKGSVIDPNKWPEGRIIINKYDALNKISAENWIKNTLDKFGGFDSDQFITESNPPNLSTVFFIQFLADILFNASYSLIMILPSGHLFGSIRLPFNDSRFLMPTLILLPSFNSLCAIFNPIPLLAPLISIVLILKLYIWKNYPKQHFKLSTMHNHQTFLYTPWSLYKHYAHRIYNLS